MRDGRCSILWMAAAAVTLIADLCAAQSPPRQPPPDMIARRTPTEADRQVIAAFADYWGQRLVEEDVDGVEEARFKLLAPLARHFNPSEAFRDTYSRALADEMRQGLEVAAGEPHRAVNCILVLQEVGTPDALQTLLEESDIGNQSAWYIRLRAAAGCGAILEAAGLNPPVVNLNDRTIESTARQLGAVARAETNPLVLRRLLDAMGKIDTPAGQTQLIEALAGVVGRLERQAQRPTLDIEAVHVAVKHLLERFAELKALGRVAETRAMSEQLAPTLVKLLSLIRVHWNDAQQSPSFKRTYGAAIAMVEQFLTRLNDEVQGQGKSPASEMYAAWERQDKPRYETDLNQWATLMSQPPYKK